MSQRAPIPRPDKFRPPIPAWVKVAVLIRQEVRCGCGCNERLVSHADTQFDHMPALAHREWNPWAGDTVPPANNPDYIIAKSKACHLRKTSGSKATSKGSDIHEIGRTRRLKEGQARHTAKMAAKLGATVCGRCFQDASACRCDANAELKAFEGLLEKCVRTPPMKRKLKGRGFQTNKDGAFKKPMHGNAVRRAAKRLHK